MTPTNDADADAAPTTVPLDERPSTSETIVEAVADATDTDPTQLPPLYDTVNTDALDMLFSERDGGTLTFEYADCTVVVHGDVTVTVTDD